MPQTHVVHECVADRVSDEARRFRKIVEHSRLEQIHRHLCIFGVLDLAILLIVLNLIAQAQESIISGFGIGIGALVLLYSLVIINGFRNKNTNYDLKFISLLSFCSGFFIIVGIIQGILSLISGYFYLIFQAILLLLLGLASRRRITTMRHPAFLQWYASGGDSPVHLRNEEVYASCPHCTSLLAVIPHKLTIHDKCPNCEGFLVTSNEEE